MHSYIELRTYIAIITNNFKPCMHVINMPEIEMHRCTQLMYVYRGVCLYDHSCMYICTRINHQIYVAIRISL